MLIFKVICINTAKEARVLYQRKLVLRKKYYFKVLLKLDIFQKDLILKIVLEYFVYSVIENFHASL